MRGLVEKGQTIAPARTLMALLAEREVLVSKPDFKFQLLVVSKPCLELTRETVVLRLRDTEKRVQDLSNDKALLLWGHAAYSFGAEALKTGQNTPRCSVAS